VGSALATTPLVALAGNPNTGKTTLFNRLTGSDQRVGNYPGVTVDRHQGHLELDGQGSVRLMDVPGSYSLSARSPEEHLAIQAICGLPPLEPPDLVVVVVDATQLTRNLYLVLQILETRTPVVIALNMVDMLADAGEEIDARALSEQLGVPVVRLSARKGEGIGELRKAMGEVLSHPRRGTPGPRWMPEDPILVSDLEAIEEELPDDWNTGGEDRRRALALWALLSIDPGDELHEVPQGLRDVVGRRRRLAKAAGRDPDLEVIRARYAWIEERLVAFKHTTRTGRASRSERVDSVLLHPVFGFLCFLLIMGVLFQTLFTWSTPLIDVVDSGITALGRLVRGALPEGILRDFLTQGLISGVGSVLVFLPQILLLFLILGVMEDSGYMSRVAFLMDRVMKLLGLHGRAFVPMLSGLACAIPAVMATRTMESRRDRLLTMMVVPLMTCSARLPVYTLIIGALFPVAANAGLIDVQGGLLVGMYLFGTLVALISAAVLSRTLIKGPRIPLILELPPYRMPQLGTVLRMMWQKGKVFMSEAGTVILACTVVLWVLLDFPHLDAETQASYAARATVIEARALDPQQERSLLAELRNERWADQRRSSWAGQIGHAMEPAIAPLGFDWKIGVGLLGSFAAREVFVATMGVVYGTGADDDEQSISSLRAKMTSDLREDGRHVYTPLVGLSLLVFFALACQCLSTVAVVKRETASWRWPIFLLVYMNILAWIASFMVYQGGKLLGFE